MIKSDNTDAIVEDLEGTGAGLDDMKACLFIVRLQQILNFIQVDDDDDKSADGDLTSADANQVPNAFPFVAILPSLSLLAVIPKPRKSSSLTFILLYKDMATR